MLYVCVFLILWNIGGDIYDPFQFGNGNQSIIGGIGDAREWEVGDDLLNNLNVLPILYNMDYLNTSFDLFFYIDASYDPILGYDVSCEVEVIRNGTTTFHREWFWNVPPIHSKI